MLTTLTVNCKLIESKASAPGGGTPGHRLFQPKSSLLTKESNDGRFILAGNHGNSLFILVARWRRMSTQLCPRSCDRPQADHDPGVLPVRRKAGGLGVDQEESWRARFIRDAHKIRQGEVQAVPRALPRSHFSIALPRFQGGDAM